MRGALAFKGTVRQTLGKIITLFVKPVERCVAKANLADHENLDTTPF
jgi:hypothetical protein